MSTDLINQLDAYGIWLEDRCATALRPQPLTVEPVDDTETRDAAEVEVTSRATVSSGRRLMLSAAVVVLISTAVVAFWSLRSAPTAPAALPADPSGALFVLPPSGDGLVLSDAAIWAGTPDPAQTGVVHGMVVGRPDGDGFVDIVGIGDSLDRPGPPFVDSWAEIDTPDGPVSVSTGGPPMAMQQRGNRWIRLTNVVDEQTIAELLRAITLTAEGIGFEPVGGFVEVDTFIHVPRVEYSTEYTVSLPDGGVTVTVSTAMASSPLLVALLAEQIEPVTINGRDGWLVSTKSDGESMHGVVWQATPNRIVGVSGDATDEQLVDLAQRLQIVDEDTWTTALPGYSRQDP
jgi:hypothetical protein